MVLMLKRGLWGRCEAHPYVTPTAPKIEGWCLVHVPYMGHRSMLCLSAFDDHPMQ